MENYSNARLHPIYRTLSQAIYDYMIYIVTGCHMSYILKWEVGGGGIPVTTRRECRRVLLKIS